MNAVDPRLERLISRLLDGEIDASQRAELDAALAADPAVGRLVEEYRLIDARAADALRLVCVGRAAIKAPRRAEPWRAQRWRIGAAVGALAAAAAVLIAVRPWDAPVDGRAVKPSAESVFEFAGPISPRASRTLRRLAGREDPAGALAVEFVDDPLIHPRSLDRSRLRDWVGVVNEAGDEIYLMERQRSRTRVGTASYEY